MFGLIVAVKQVYDKYAEDEMTVYAAQVSFSLSCPWCRLSCCC